MASHEQIQANITEVNTGWGWVQYFLNTYIGRQRVKNVTTALQLQQRRNY